MVTGDGEGMIVVKKWMNGHPDYDETLAEMIVDVRRHRPRSQRRKPTEQSREG